MVKPIETEEPSKYYDEREFVKQEIEPILVEVHRKCDERNIPFVFIVESRNDEKEITMSSGCVIPKNRITPRMARVSTMIGDNEEAIMKMGMLAAALMENDDEHL